MGRHDIDAESIDKMKIFELEAAKNAISVFSEGYLLGMKHAKKVFGIEDEDKD